MKKLLLTTAACAVLASSPAFAAEGDFFVGLNGGWSKLSKVKGFKSKNDAFVGVGVGYSIMDNVRIDLTFDHDFNPEFTKTDSVQKIGYIKTIKSKVKLNINSLLLNTYVDLFDVSIFKMYVGAGVGASRIDTKINSNYSYDDGTPSRDSNAKIKAKNYFAYALQIGASAEVAPGVHADLSYKFKDNGKDKTNKKQIQAHQVGAGVRFEI